MTRLLVGAGALGALLVGLWLTARWLPGAWLERELEARGWQVDEVHFDRVDVSGIHGAKIRVTREGVEVLVEGLEVVPGGAGFVLLADALTVRISNGERSGAGDVQGAPSAGELWESLSVLPGLPHHAAVINQVTVCVPGCLTGTFAWRVDDSGVSSSLISRGNGWLSIGMTPDLQMQIEGAGSSLPATWLVQSLTVAGSSSQLDIAGRLSIQPTADWLDVPLPAAFEGAIDISRADLRFGYALDSRTPVDREIAGALVGETSALVSLTGQVEVPGGITFDDWEPLYALVPSTSPLTFQLDRDVGVSGNSGVGPVSVRAGSGSSCYRAAGGFQCGLVSIVARAVGDNGVNASLHFEKLIADVTAGVTTASGMAQFTVDWEGERWIDAPLQAQLANHRLSFGGDEVLLRNLHPLQLELVQDLTNSAGRGSVHYDGPPGLLAPLLPANDTGVSGSVRLAVSATWQVDSAAMGTKVGGTLGVNLEHDGESRLRTSLDATFEDGRLRASDDDAMVQGIEPVKLDIAYDSNAATTLASATYTGSPEPFATLLPSGLTLEAQGNLDVVVSSKWREGLGSSVSGSISGTDLIVSYSHIMATGLAVDATITGWPAWSSAVPVAVRIRTLDAGVPLTNANLSFRARGESVAGWAIDGVSLDANLLGGRITSNNFAYSRLTRLGHASLEVERVQLEQVLSLEGEEFESQGQLSGSVPVQIENDNIRIEGGQFAALEPGGVIRYRPDSSGILASNAQLKLVTDALEDFHYDELTAEVGYDSVPGTLIARTTLRGRNPGYQDGREIHFSVNIEEDLNGLLRSLQLSDDIVDELERRSRR